MSLFQPFPKQRGPLKILVYGEPGTLKTRRALQMPDPIFMIDLECGAADYGDLIAANAGPSSGQASDSHGGLQA